MKKYTNDSQGFAHLLLLIIVLVVLAVGFMYYKKMPLPWFNKLLSKQEKVTTLPKVEVAEGTKIKDFPDFPSLPNSELQSTQYTEAQTTPYSLPASYQAFLESTDSRNVKEIIDWYKTELVKSGWKIDREPEDPASDNQSIGASKDSMKANVDVEQENDETSVAITIEMGDR